jgi:hypothetical protein
MQDAAFADPFDGKEKIWSESNVSEDFDMALRMLQRGYLIRCGDTPYCPFISLIKLCRWATYSKGGFKEGVSLSVDDELNRWQKYAYGCNELRGFLSYVVSRFTDTALLFPLTCRLLFNPLVQWWRRGPIAPQIHKFIWSNAPLHYKISMLSCTYPMFY